jgi:hypothetical protein
MPAMMLFWGITFPAGLVLYWFVSNVFEMVRLYFTMGPQSLAGGSSDGAASGGLGFGFGALFGGPKPSNDGNGAQPVEEKSTADIRGDGTRTERRPARPRGKRGKRSGRR